MCAVLTNSRDLLAISVAPVEGAAEQTVVGETPKPRRAPPGARGAGQRRDQPGDAKAGRRTVRADRSRPRRLKGFAEPARASGRSKVRRAEGRFEALHGEPLTLVGRERRARHPARALGVGQGRRRAGGPDLGRARDRQVAAGPGAARGRARRRPSTPAPPLVLASHTNSALLPGIILLRRRRARARRPPEARLARLAGAARPLRGRRDELVPCSPPYWAGAGARERRAKPARCTRRRTLKALIDQSLIWPARIAPLLARPRGRTLDRPHDAQELFGLVVERRPAAARAPGRDHLPAGIPSALGRPGPRDHAHADPSRSSRGRGRLSTGLPVENKALPEPRSWPDLARPTACPCWSRSWPGRSGIGPAFGGGGALRRSRRAPAARDPGDPAGLAHGPPRPAGAAPRRWRRSAP